MASNLLLLRRAGFLYNQTFASERSTEVCVITKSSFGVASVRARVVAGVLMSALVLVAQTAMAQSTIFNIPSTDTVDKGKVYGELDFLPQLPAPDAGASTMIFNPRVVIGLPHDMEAGVNVPIIHNSDGSPSSLAYVQPNIKWKFYKNDATALATTAGVIVNVPVNHRDAQSTWGYGYANISKKFPKAMGLRLTVGGYGVATKSDGTGFAAGPSNTKAGVLAGVEQPLHGPVSFVADWFSGKNGLGYLTPGVSITLPHSSLLNIGYSFGNDSWKDTESPKDRFLFVYYGIVF
jgi:hypothetical protein